MMQATKTNKLGLSRSISHLTNKRWCMEKLPLPSSQLNHVKSTMRPCKAGVF